MALSEYYDGLNKNLLELLPRGVRRIVESGCGTGALGEAYKQDNPETEYLGLELHPEAVALAATRLDRVAEGDVEELGPEALGIEPGSVDCLVYGDVLEHLIDPWSVVQRQAEWLRVGGTTVACIPNIQNWAALLTVLHGQWPYQDEGLFDRTHLRFFTLEGAIGLFADAGLKVFDVRGRCLPPKPEQEQFQEAIRPALTALGINVEHFVNRSACLQYLVRAVKEP